MEAVNILRVRVIVIRLTARWNGNSDAPAKSIAATRCSVDDNQARIIGG